MADTQTSAKRRRPRLPIDLAEFNAVLRQEIDRAPQTLPGQIAAAVAAAIIEGYTIPRSVQQLFFRERLEQLVFDLLVPNGTDAEAGDE